MSGTQPVGVYAMKVPPGDILLPAVPDFAAMFRVSMAAIDPSEEPVYDDDVEAKTKPRATLKIVRVPGDMFDEDSDDSDYDEDTDDLLNGLGEDSDEESDEEVNGGPSNPKKSKKALIKAEADDDDDEEDDDDEMVDGEEDMSEDDAAAEAALRKIMKTAKGKSKAEGKEDDEDSDLEDDEDPLELEEIVVCTLDPEKNYQQPLDFVVGENERIFFKVSGNHTVYLTGNYVIPMDDGEAQLYGDEEDEDYDLSPDEDELDALEDGDEESDELDDIDDPRITEIDAEDETLTVPELTKAAAKGKNKRPAEGSADEDESDANLDDIMAKSLKKEETTLVTNGEPKKKLTKAEKKAAKKLKKNDGEAAPVSTFDGTASQAPESKKETLTNGNEKKVQFAKNLEQGPTPSAAPSTKLDTKSAAKPAASTIRDVQGVTVDDRKTGTGPAAKKGSKVEMRYIGKLESGKQFDANKKGKPFAFKLGMGEVIKGWDIGVEGMASGGERRLTIPAHLGYGKKGAPPDIPPNSKLIFDIKCLSVK